MKKLIKYGASWCGPCKRQDQEFKDNSPKYPLEIVDVEELPEDELEKLEIRSIPVIQLYDDDKLLNTWYGYTPTKVIDEYNVDE